MRIHLDHDSDDARAHQRVFLDLVAAAIGDRDVYLSELQSLLNDVLAGAAPAERIVYLVDAAAQVTKSSLRAWAALLDASEQDVMLLLESDWPIDDED